MLFQTGFAAAAGVYQHALNFGEGYMEKRREIDKEYDNKWIRYGKWVWAILFGGGILIITIIYTEYML